MHRSQTHHFVIFLHASLGDPFVTAESKDRMNEEMERKRSQRTSFSSFARLSGRSSV